MTTKPTPVHSRKTFLDVPSDDVLAFAQSHQVPVYHARQIYDWLFKKRVSRFLEMTNLPRSFRETLESRYRLHPLEVRRKDTSSLDGTIRYYFTGHDGKDISTVYLPEGSGFPCACPRRSVVPIAAPSVPRGWFPSSGS